jgi:hypothetical protein
MIARPMEEDTIGFDAKRPIGLWNKRIGLDGTGLFKAALKGALAYFTSRPAAAVSAAIDGAFAIKVEAKPLRPEEQAWLLIQRALARAMAKLAAEAREKEAFESSDVRNLIDSLDQSLAGQSIRIGQDFLDQPAGHDAVKVVCAGFAKWLVSLGLSELQARQIAKRLGRYFTFSLHREWAAYHQNYAELARAIESWNTPFAKAGTRERAWILNAAWLQRQIEEPLFEETFGLCEVYVPLRAYWVERKVDDRRRSTREESLGLDREVRQVVDLRSHLRAWLDRPDKDDAIRVISGGPGSGKSSFAKMLAAELAAEEEDRHILYVPLHQFDFAGDFRAAVRKFVIEDMHILDHDPLNPDEERRRLVVFFDGLDELAMHGASGQEAASDFVAALDRAIGTVNYRDCRLQVILGGREIVVQANERVFRREQQVLNVLPYVVSKLEEAPRHLLYRESLHDPNDLLATDQRDLWWQKYGTASGRDHHCLPESLRAPALIEISGQPLLNYLLALSFDRGRISFGPDLNLNELYKDLLDAVWERRWGEGRQLPEVERLTKPEFEQLLEEIGLAAWHAGTRGVAASRVAEICCATGLDRELQSFQAGAEKGALTLLAAFYFRQASRTGERTFEFTHKSFGEYLTARRLVRWVEDIHEERARNRSNRRQRGWSEEEALTKWIEVTGPAILDSDLLNFLGREVALQAPEVVIEWKKTLADLFSDQLQQGLPMHKLGPLVYLEMTRQARNAEEALLAAHFCCALVTRDPSPIRWPSVLTMRDLIFRLDRGSLASLGRYCLGWLASDNEPHWLNGVSLDWANLEGADLSGANLRGADLEGANLGGANLRGANLERANLERANLYGANLERAKLSWANLGGANLHGANLCGANLGGANLDGANLGGANLHGANLKGAVLLSVRDLDKARGLDEVRSWKDATIERKWVKRLGLDAEKLGLKVVDD